MGRSKESSSWRDFEGQAERFLEKELGSPIFDESGSREELAWAMHEAAIERQRIQLAQTEGNDAA